MTLKIGIDVGGTFTDFLVTRDGAEPAIFKVAVDAGGSVDRPGQRPGGDRRQHGSAAVARSVRAEHRHHRARHDGDHQRGADRQRRARPGCSPPTGCATRSRCAAASARSSTTTATPTCRRWCRATCAAGVGGRLDHAGEETEPLDARRRARRPSSCCRREGVEAVAICFMNSFANPDHEQAGRGDRAPRAARRLPLGLHRGAAVDPLLRPGQHHRAQRLRRARSSAATSTAWSRGCRTSASAGVLLIMQSNGGVISPQVAREKAALTLLSGPAAGPGRGPGLRRARTATTTASPSTWAAPASTRRWSATARR